MSWRVHQDPNLEPLAAVWAAAEAAAPHSVFQGFAFARHWAACFGHEAELCIGWQAKPPLIVPLARRASGWGFVGEGLFDYQDIVGPAAPEQQRAAGLWAREQMCGPVCITGVAEVTARAGFWRAIGLTPQPFAAAPLRAAGADTLAAEHPRTARRWEAAHACLAPVEDPRERLHLLDWLLEHKQRGLAAQGRANVLGGAECRWLRRMVVCAPEVTELWALRRLGATLAALLCWRSPTMRYAYTIAYDRAAAAISPGVLALFALLRHTMREGRSFNFLTGEQSFKRRFATQSDSLLRYQSTHV